MPCPIWGTTADALPKTGGFTVYESPRAGGRYWISDSAEAMLPNATIADKLRITTWLCRQRRAGIDTPKIDSDLIRLAQTLPTLSVPARLEACLLFLADNSLKLSNEIYFNNNNPDSLFLRSAAETESEDLRDVFELLKMLTEIGLVHSNLMIGGGRFKPTVSGWMRAEEMRSVRASTSQCFVAMWFNDETQDAYENGLAKAIANAGYSPMRIDKKHHNNKIDDEILAEIRRSRFLVADFTCQPEKVRGGVYFEAGLAMGLNLPVIWTCKDSSMRDLHFDTRQYAHIVWKDPADLCEQLKARIGATLGDGPLKK
jgi:hypothetical protein